MSLLVAMPVEAQKKQIPYLILSGMKAALSLGIAAFSSPPIYG